MSRAAPSFLVLLACAEPGPQGADDATRLDGRVVGPLVGDPAVVVGLIDSARWREDEVSSVATMERWDPASGAFSLRLPERVEARRPWETFFVAAWRDADRDGRRDRATEPLCDQPTQGDVVYLTFPRDPEGIGGWAVGAARTHVDAVGLHVTVDLDSSRCATY